MAFSKWYQLPFQLALWEVLESMDQMKLHTVHCDIEAGWVLAEHRTWTMDAGLVDISVTAHPEFGSTVSLTSEVYWSKTRKAMSKAFNDLLWNLDNRLNVRAHEFSMAVRSAEAEGVRFNWDKGTDLDSRSKVMDRPRAMGAVALAVMIAVVFMLPIPLQNTTFEMMVYLALASPFLLSAVVIAAGRFAEGGLFLFYVGLAIGLFFSIFSFFLSMAIIPPAMKGGTRALGADIKQERYETLSEGSRSAPRTIEIEHRYT